MISVAHKDAASLADLYADTFHELRVPVSSINGYASILLTGELGKLAPRQREPLQRIQSLCKVLVNLISNLLVITKPGTRTVQSAPQLLDIRSMIIQDVIPSIEGELRRKKIKFMSRVPSKSPRFFGDPAGVFQIFLNLLSNAVKFTPSGGRVTLAASFRLSHLAIEVADTGVGIPSEDLSKIFEEFYHVDHPEVGADAGSGLGLAIVKRVVDASGGRINVSSRIGRGTRFFISLPIRPEKQILLEFLEKNWAQAKKAGQSMGLILLQVKSRQARALLPLVERELRGQLKKEDSIFRLSHPSCLAIPIQARRKEFFIFVRCLEGILRKLLAKDSRLRGRRAPWRLVSLLAPKRGGSPRRALAAAESRLNQVWEGGNDGTS